MRRRTFLATLPLAAAGSSSFAKNVVNSPSPGAVQEAGTARLPKYQAPGDERFERPDVHAGDRPSGASFASRSAALGCSGAAGTAHPIATQAAIEMLKRGGSAADAAVAANACLGFLEPTSCRSGRRLLCVVVGSEAGEGDGDGELGEVSEVAVARDGALTREEWSAAQAGSGYGFNTGRAGRMVDSSSALRQAEVGGVV